MHKSFVVVMTFIGLIAGAKAQAPKEKTLLWEISGKGITKPSWLFGTIHLMCTDELKMPKVVEAKFNTASKLFLEIDMDDPNMMKDMLSGMQMKDSSTLENLMGKKFDSVSTIFQNTTGMPLRMLNTAKPFLLISMLYPSILQCTPVSWESVFQKMAKEKGMEIEGLEKLEDQMKIFDKIPYKLQSDILVKMLLNIDSSKKEFDTMLDVYKHKDINQLNVLTNKEEDFGEYTDILLDDRNHNWIPVIGEQAKKMPTFFAFGAGHLGGEKGVINLLRKAGFTVKPVFYQ
ncbi:TraB/GumN family protein [Segetibacter koreensis]|uniref:TraB/GumN family protein n=1 Tax=Segetibacter koreensis TaxID=398037 RepID=UPI00037A99C5|nr:TraB/GumN family protein [Segetibacter koreensis]